jgi:decaprenyl-phosphate phosphoribosyltransferase
MKVIFQLLRLSHWVKNLFLFIPAFFGGKLFEVQILLQVTIGFVAYGLTASSIYIINDLKDVEKDRLHPEKKNRPIASGKVNVRSAIVAAALCMVLGLLISWTIGGSFIYIPLAYILMNLAYTFKLKQIALIDIMIISLGFLLRVYAGGVLADVPLSKWLIIMIFLLALFLALAKRRDDLLLEDKDGVKHRKSLDGYNLEFVNGSLYLLSSIIVVAYILYTVSEEVISYHKADQLYLSSFWVLMGMLRYLQITLVEKNSGNPTKILIRDGVIQFILLGWIITLALLFYL